MCEFISWVEHRGKIKFLTGEQLFTDRGREFIKTNGISPDDYCGHGTIRLWWGIDSGDGVNWECTDFSTPDNFPPKIVTAITAGKFRGMGTPVQLLSEPAQAEYNKIEQSALAEYHKIEQPAQAEYNKKIKQTALAEYKKIKQTALAEFNKIEQSALAEYNKIEQPAWAEYHKIKQQTFWDLFLADEKNRNPKWR